MAKATRKQAEALLRLCGLVNPDGFVFVRRPGKPSRPVDALTVVNGATKAFGLPNRFGAPEPKKKRGAKR